MTKLFNEFLEEFEAFREGYSKSTPNPETGENFPFIFKRQYLDKGIPPQYDNHRFYSVDCDICKTKWWLIDILYLRARPEWVCPDPNCQRAKYNRETVELLGKKLDERL